MGWTDYVTKNNPIAGGVRAGYDLATGHPVDAAKDFAAGQTLGASDQVWNSVTGAYEKAKNSLYPDAPPPLSQTDAAKQATTYAGKLVSAQGNLPQPTYGSSQQIPVARPSGPSDADRALVAGAANPPPVPTGGVAPISNKAATDAAANGYSFGESAPGGDKAGAAALADAKARIAAAEQQQAQWDAIYGGQAQQSNATVTAGQVTTPTLGSSFTMQAPTASAPQLAGGAPQIGSLPTVAAQAINAPGAIQAGSVQAQQLGHQGMAPVADISQGGQARDAQLEALGMYRDVANGTAPSAAQALLRQSTDESIGAQLGMAATLQGNTPGLALRSGLSGAANALAKSGASMAALRAQEQETGRAGFLSAATGIRGADVAIAQSNQTKDLTSSVQTMQANLDAMKANQQAALSAGQSNVAADLQAKIATANNQLDAAKSNAANSLSADVANLTAKLDASKANQAAQVQQNIANLSSQLSIAQANLQSALQTGLAGEANKLQAGIAQMQASLDSQKANQQALLDAAKANMQNSQFNAQMGQQQQQFNSGAALTASQQNAQNALTQQQINNNLYTGVSQLATNALGVPLGVAQQDRQALLDWQNKNSATTAGLIGGGLGLAGKVAGMV